MEAVPEPRLLEAEVTLDMVELLAQRHVRAAVTEQVARELGKVDQQLAGLVGPGILPATAASALKMKCGEI